MKESFMAFPSVYATSLVEVQSFVPRYTIFLRKTVAPVEVKKGKWMTDDILELSGQSCLPRGNAKLYVGVISFLYHE